MIPGIKIKNGVVINGRHFEPEVWKIIHAAQVTAPPTTDGFIWITSANDGRHMEGSKHYSNEAFDIRIWNIKGSHATARTWTTSMNLMLGEDYDIILESDHIHGEFDPRG